MPDWNDDGRPKRSYFRPEADRPLTRWVPGALGTLAVIGIVGTVGMYGQLQSVLAQVYAQETHIEILDKRIQSCENIIRRREEAMKQ